VNIDIEQIERLMQALRNHDFHELEIQQGEERIALRRSVVPAVAGVTGTALPALPLPTGERERAVRIDEARAPEVPATDPALFTVTAPLVGTFYRAPAPEARPFVEVGSLVRKGTVLCIVEAFKLMNEIESEVDGVVAEVLVDNGKPVEFGQPLLRIRRSG
jgi:acetyl-CoA carboxylase biotin carboxyl carrier protein